MTRGTAPVTGASTLSDMNGTTSTRVDDLVEEYRTSSASRAVELRQEIAVLCLPQLNDEIADIAGTYRVDVEELRATGQLTFLELLPKLLDDYRPERASGSFDGWVRRTLSWRNTVVRAARAAGRVEELNDSDDRLLRIYHGCREAFAHREGRDWTIEEAREEIRGHLYGTVTDRYRRKHPDLPQEALELKVEQRVRRDGLRSRLGRLEEILLDEVHTRPVSLDAELDEDFTLADTLADLEPQEEVADLGEVDAWTRLAVLGMTGRDARRMVAHLAGDQSAPDELVARSRSTMTNPLAQFVALVGVEGQLEECAPASGATGEARTLLVAAAALS